ncbi:EAL domain-containing protein [Arcobacter sp. YIC-310]|uniref:EAL domain-containing protein n=1 Tax=Arcobacter sp. YIC-310 TaxID=3376632 RepID=UPI003C23F3CE
MHKINYKRTYLIIYFLTVIVLIFAVTYIFEIKDKMNVNKISSDKFEEKFKSHETSIYNFFETYKDTLNALARNKTLQDYINYSKSKKEVQELFLTLNDSLKYSFQLRYINKNGLEKIKVDKDINSSLKATSKIITDDLLQDKSKRKYVQKFLDIQNNDIVMSDINLQKEFGKIIEPKIPTIRLATSVYTKDGKKSGFIVLNIQLSSFFQNLQKSTLYNIYLVDNKNRFITHPNKKYGITSDNFDIYLLKNEIGEKQAKLALSKTTINNKDFFIKDLNSTILDQKIRVLFTPKFKNLQIEQEESQLSIYVILLIAAVLFLPVIFYFASIPDLLRGKIRKQSITDSLTSLPNKEKLFQDLSSNKRVQKRIVILLHIDSYNRIHDAYGYKVAEELIKECSLFLSKFKYKNSFYKLYRISKNCFAFTYDFKRKEDLLSVLDHLHYSIENQSFKVLNNNFEVLTNATISISNIEAPNNTIEDLKEAEVALSDALTRKIDINIFNNENKKNIEINKKNILTVNQIKKAIETDNVIIQFQAIYNNRKDCIDKYETLIRLKVDNKLLYPGEFLDIAKEIKKYKKLTMIVIDKAFEYFKDKKDVSFSINLSIEDISCQDIRKHLFKQMQKYNINDRLVLEIVETETINNYENFLFFIKKAKAHGCKIAIDDFGSGYSNYEYIVKLSDYIDFLKIDGSLIIGLDENPKRQLLVGTLKFLCDSLNIQTIAEYVESQELFDYVKSMGIHYSQGYYIGKAEDGIKVA